LHDFVNILTGRGESRAPLSAGILSVQMCLLAREACRTRTVQEMSSLSRAKVAAR